MKHDTQTLLTKERIQKTIKYSKNLKTVLSRIDKEFIQSEQITWYMCEMPRHRQIKMYHGEDIFIIKLKFFFGFIPYWNVSICPFKEDLHDD